MVSASTLIIVSGPPGAGKSTVAAMLADRHDPSLLVVGDRFFDFLRVGAIPPWLPESSEQNKAVVEAAALATGRLARHATTVYDGVIGPWYLDTFLAGTGIARAAYVVLLPPLEVCLHRVATRTGHDFSDAGATRQMWQEFTDAEVDRRHLVTDVTTADELTALVDAGVTAGRYDVSRV